MNNCYFPKILCKKTYNAIKDWPDIWDKETREIYDWIHLHVLYKRLYISQLIITMSSSLWIPFFIGFLYFSIKFGFCTYAGKYAPLCFGFGNMCLVALLYPVTIPLSIFLSTVIFPYILKNIMFNEYIPYNDDIMLLLKLGKSIERNIFISTIAGTTLEKYIK